MLDERSAGFSALGIGWPPAGRRSCSPPAAPPRSSSTPPWSRPTRPGCRSWPCTADRPPELHDVGAPQTDRAGRPVRRRGALGRPTAGPPAPWPPPVVAVAGRPGRGRGRRRGRPARARCTSTSPFREPLLGAAGDVPAGRRRRRVRGTVRAVGRGAVAAARRRWSTRLLDRRVGEA